MQAGELNTSWRGENNIHKVYVHMIVYMMLERETCARRKSQCATSYV